MALPGDLVKTIPDLPAARDLAVESLKYMAGLPQSDVHASPYIIRTVTVNGRDRIVRPINTTIFIADPKKFSDDFDDFSDLLDDLKATKGALAAGKAGSVRSSKLITRTLYTMTQAIGIGLDCLVDSNTARKNYGSRLEDTVKAMFHQLGCGTKDLTLALPYKLAGVTTTFRNQIDLVISEKPPVKTVPTKIDPDDVIVSVKSSSKDRMSKVFLDKEVLRFITQTDLPVIALFHNDVQRSGTNRVRGTFVAGNFLAYVAAFGPLNGVYYVDPPQAASKKPWDKYVKTYDDLLLDDLWSMF